VFVLAIPVFGQFLGEIFFERASGLNNNNNHLTAVVRGNPGSPVPEETFTHSHPS